MKRIKLAYIHTRQSLDNTIILADKDQTATLEPYLEVSEFAFLNQMSTRDSTNFFFPRAEGSVFVRLFKTDKDEYADVEATRLAGNAILGELAQYKFESITILNTCEKNRALPFAEGLALGSYQFNRHFSKPDEKDAALKTIQILDPSATEAEVQEMDRLIEAVFHTRDLVNEPFSHLNAPQLADFAEKAGKEYGFSVETLEEEQIRSLKMGGLLAINQASHIPPRFSVLEYKPVNAKNEKPVVLVGKGVVYDTGGLSIKPSEGMDYMKCDMGGAAVVIGAFIAAASNQLPIHIIGLIPITDNLVGREAITPGDVITMYSGATVEVMNTDAEGRIILADALHYAKKFHPELVLDFATLTGAAVRAFGSIATCYMGNASIEVRKNIEVSGMQTYERLIEVPLWKEYGEEMKSTIADIKNLGGVSAGMITAGKFLEHFVDYPWLHFDIAGPAYVRAGSGYRTKGASGMGVRLMYDFLKRYCS